MDERMLRAMVARLGRRRRTSQSRRLAARPARIVRLDRSTLLRGYRRAIHRPTEMVSRQY